jgi:hypothetical protein
MVLDDYEFGQAVMVAAGVKGESQRHEFHDSRLSDETLCICGAEFGTVPRHDRCPSRGLSYPDPLTTTGNAELWDVLVAKGYFVRVASPPHGEIHLARVYGASTMPVVENANRKLTLLEAAALALGVTR